jgi:peptidoglycan/LPS O-acetylase OafA/YrhL
MLTVGYTVVYLGFGLLLLAVITGARSAEPTVPPGVLLAPLAFVGFHSYSIYLWHIPVRRGLSPILERFGGGSPPGLLEPALYLVGSVVGGYAMAKLIELPFLRLRNHYFPSVGQRSAAPKNSPPRREQPSIAKVTA